jgi:hypothetical protein
MSTRITLVALLGTLGLLVTVFELVRQRRLQERYSLLWLFTGLVLFVLAAWHSALETISQAVGVYYPPTTLFLLAGAFFLVVLLHYSTVISRLAEQNTRLAQRLALLEERVDGLPER